MRRKVGRAETAGRSEWLPQSGGVENGAPWPLF